MIPIGLLRPHVKPNTGMSLEVNALASVPIILNKNPFGVYDAWVNYGDGTPDFYIDSSSSSNLEHSYGSDGIYTIMVEGVIERFTTKYGDNLQTYLTKINNIGDIGSDYISFQDCVNLTDVEGAISSQNAICRSLFEGCASLTNVNQDLLKFNRSTTYESAFEGCTSLIPPTNIFKSAYTATNFNYVFKDTLVGSANSYFPNCRNLTTINYGFQNTPIISPNTNAFKYCPLLTSSIGCFKGCTNISSAYDIFTYSPNISNIAELFYGCTSLVSISSTIFRGFHGINSMNSVFRDCSSLTSLPSNLYSDTPNITSFSYTFFGTILTTLPSNLFVNTQLVTRYDRCFSEVKNISLPATLFDLSSMSIVTNFTEMFKQLNTSDSPTGTIQDIWNYSTPSSYFDTFLNCTALTNYASIPTDWK